MSDQQQLAIDIINKGEPLFLSGAGGYGKSWVIEQTTTPRTVVGAPTATAAKNVGGETINSLFSLPMGVVAEADKGVGGLRPKVKKLFEGDYVNRITLEEISMIRADKLDLIDDRLRTIRGVDRPFGGIQPVFVGDFYQLPTIVQKDEASLFRRMYKSPHAFRSNVWQELNPRIVQLTEPKRNENVDQVHLLQAIRVKDERMVKGKEMYKHAIDRVNSWARPDDTPSQLHLCCYLADVKKRNQHWYDQINTSEVIIRGTREGTFKGARTVVPDELRLKVGTQIVLCANNKEAGYINGDTGIISQINNKDVVVTLMSGDIVYVEEHIWEKYEYVRSLGGLERKVTGTYKQLPIKLGYGLSIHSAQGMTLDSITLDLGKRAFAPAQLYVALSRVRDLKNVALTRKIKYDDCIVDKKVQKFFADI